MNPCESQEFYQNGSQKKAKKVKLIFHFSKDRDESSLLMHYKSLTKHANRECLILSPAGCSRAIL